MDRVYEIKMGKDDLQLPCRPLNKTFYSAQLYYYFLGYHLVFGKISYQFRCWSNISNYSGTFI